MIFTFSVPALSTGTGLASSGSALLCPDPSARMVSQGGDDAWWPQGQAAVALGTCTASLCPGLVWPRSPSGHRGGSLGRHVAGGTRGGLVFSEEQLSGGEKMWCFGGICQF